MLKKYEFGLEAIQYIREQSYMDKTLSAYLFALPLEKGSVVAYLPMNVSPEASRDFNAGGIARIAETEPRLAGFIMEYLGGRGKPYVVFEDAFKLSTDLSLQRADYIYFTHRSEVYHFLTSRDRDTARIISTIRTARCYPFLGALTSIPDDEPDIQCCQEVSNEFLRMLAMRTKHIIVGAYDLEAQLIWTAPS